MHRPPQPRMSGASSNRRGMSGGSSAPAKPASRLFARAVSMKFARAGISTASSRPRLSARGVCSSTPAKPASPISEMRSGSKPSSAKTTPRILTRRATSPQRLDALRQLRVSRQTRPRRSPLLHRPCPSPLPRERQAASRPARRLRSPAAARSPPRRSRAQRPAKRRRTPPSGSRRSMMSAPCAIAISASCGPLTLASIKVIGLLSFQVANGALSCRT